MNIELLNIGSLLKKLRRKRCRQGSSNEKKVQLETFFFSFLVLFQKKIIPLRFEK